MAQTKVQEREETTHTREASKWKPDSIFWGGALVFIGILLLLNTVGTLNTDIWALWRLWPIAIIAVGISLFAPKGWVSRACNIGLLIITILLALYVTTIGNGATQTNGDVQTHSFSRGILGINTAKVMVEAGAVQLNLNTSSMRNVAEAKLDSEHAELKTSNNTKDGVQTSNIELSSRGFPWVPTGKSVLDVTIGQEVPTDLSVDSGASKITGDLSAANLRSFTLDAGASSVDMKFGSKQTTQRLIIDGGASSMTFRVPKSADVQVKMDAGLVSKDFDDMNEISKDTYETSDFTASERKIYITINAGASKLTVIRY